MNKKLMQLANAAARYAFEHDLTIPTPSMTKSAWAKAISDAVEHATDHPRNTHARALLQADKAFADSN